MAAKKAAGGGPRGGAVRTPTDIEGLGVFYLGRKVEGAAAGEPLLVDARRFTTHAVCVGMTGSGKTGLLAALFVLGAWPDPLVRALDRATGRLLGVATHAPADEQDPAAASAADLQDSPHGS